MAERRDYVALDWVSGEIEETLKQARQALEAYVSEPEDVTKLRFCLTYAHQVHGTLRMVEFEGATLFARELEALAQALVNGAIDNIDDALEILMGGLLQLPRYLSQVRQARRDIPGVLMPAVNEMRAVRGETPLKESALFAPRITGASVSSSPEINLRDDEFRQLVTKLRQVFQIAFVGIIRNKQLGQNLEHLARVCQRLQRLSAGKPREALWTISLGIIEGLAQRKISPNAAVKSLLKQMDSEIKALLANGPSWFDEQPDQELLREFLYLIARAEGGSSRIDALKEQYKLDDALASSEAGEETSQVDPDAMKSVVAALAEELASVKDYLDIYLRSDRREIDALQSAQPIFKRVVNTMAVLGLGEPLQRLRTQAEKLDQYIDGEGSDDPDALLDIASAIIGVEASLEWYGDNSHGGAISDEPQFDQAREIVVREARNGLEQVKESIIEFVASQWDHERLAPVPALLAGVRGSITMVGLTKAAKVLQACERYISEALLAESRVPEWQILDTLADAVSSVDYYLERLTTEENGGDERILAVAEESVATLGYALESLDDMPPPAAVPVLTTDAALAEVVPLYPHDPESELDPELQAEVTPPEAEDQPVEPADNPSEPHAEEAQVAQPDEIAEPEAGDDEISVAATDGFEDADSDGASMEAGEPESAAASDDNGVEVDDEILEIFIEEAGEVLETINEFLPQWRDDAENSEALTEVRRAWHTLKGSGRMVGASDIGELAWSVENMLNRVIDHTVPADAVRIAMVEKAAAIIPGLIELLNSRGGVDAGQLEKIRDMAFALAEESALTTADIDAIDPARLFAPASSAPVEAGEEPGGTTDAQTADVEAVEVAPDGEAEDIEAAGFGETVESDEAIAQEQPIDATVDAESPDAGESPEPDDEEHLLLEIFEAEAEAHLAVIDAFTAADIGRIDPMPVTDDLQRALHTLKGSAYMAAYQAVVDVVVPVEQLLKEMQAARVRADNQVVELLRQLAEMVRMSLVALKQDGVRLESLPGTEALVETARELRSHRHDQIVQTTGVEDDKSYIARLSQFLADSAGALEVIEPLVDDWEQVSAQADRRGQLCDRLAYLNEQAAALTLQPVAALLGAWLAVASGKAGPAENGAALQRQCVEELTTMLDALAADRHIPDASPAIMEALQSTPVDSPEEAGDLQANDAGGLSPEAYTADATDDEGVGDTLTDYQPTAEIHTRSPDSGENPAEVEFDVDSAEHIAFDQVQQGHAEEPEPVALQPESMIVDFGDLESSNESDEAPADFGTVGYDVGVSDDSESVSEPVSEADEAPWSPWSPPADAVINEVDVDLAQAAVPEVDEQFDEVADEQLLDELEADLETPEAFEVTVDNEEAVEAVDEAVDEAAGQEVDIPAEVAEEIPVSADTTPPVAEAVTEEESVAVDDDDDVDEEIREIFLEEARDILESIDESIQAWLGERDNRLHLELLQRQLHTLKGGARLAGLTKLGNLSHNFETFLINADQENIGFDEDFFARVQQFQDQVVAMVDAVTNGGVEPAFEETGQVEVTPAPSPAVQPEAGTAQSPADSPASTPTVPAAQPDDGRPAHMRVEQLNEAMHGRAATAEVVRVAASLVEQLVNLAGETSISRGRVEEQVNEVAFALDEMDVIIERIQEQLRRLDIETEAQILFRQEQVENLGLEEFDPLEMDRYSLLQQLSRSLMESASDIRDIKGTIGEKARDIETLLLQQSRINTDLQEGLMRSRMVPFSRMVPRLRRIVRQVSVELDKRVELVLDNIEGEMDRTLLERMVAPFEHMLRNAVDHGIESADQRLEAGKPEQGTINISLAREGGEVVITIADDGRGINLEAVRSKAIERGLLAPEAKLSDHEILQFILQSGFSTASAVTQISGRGVGMDVVHSEIKQLGGSMDIESDAGRGTRFLIRLPFTVSVNRALMVRVGSETYALPLNTIEGIVRVSPFELEAYYQPDAPPFEYAGESYQLRYIGSLLGTYDKPHLNDQTLPLPVILVRSTEHSMAIQVDSLLGSREIVVKTLGPQFAAVQGLSGATVLGDGSVVVILDLLALIRAAATLTQQHVLEHEPRARAVEAKVQTVMVVDDSVTVRKVTSRFLERSGLEVMLAKDGVDAVQQLQDRKPDLMLLDIEMPRMDGFEVASRIKHSENLKDIPIIMITSRTGDKHRQRAMSLGVERYLGKPYQELELLKTIKEITGWELG